MDEHSPLSESDVKATLKELFPDGAVSPHFAHALFLTPIAEDSKTEAIPLSSIEKIKELLAHAGDPQSLIMVVELIGDLSRVGMALY